MPREKRTTMYRSKNSWLSIFRQIREGESYTSLLLGIIVVIILGIIVLSVIKRSSSKPSIGQNGASTVAEKISQKQQGEKNSPSVKEEQYTIKQDDSLWSIAQTKYENGYNWVDIAKANNLQNPDAIDVGQHITLPRIETKTLSTSTGPEMKTGPPQSQNAITGNSYKVVKGDYVWNIALRAYGDGYRWVDIAKDNKLANPNLIHSGNVFTIPR